MINKDRLDIRERTYNLIFIFLRYSAKLSIRRQIQNEPSSKNNP